MVKKIAMFVVSGFLLLNAYGCFALLAGAVGGAGTAVWLSGKLAQQFDAPYERTVRACESALADLNLEITKQTKEEDVTQLKSRYTDGKEIWVDVKKITENSTKVEVRVGGVDANKQASADILNKIKEHIDAG